ncbi:uncharacterized protein [Primulina eburnea]|uniref:uncharacterized protein n=1 Tax=Primulina eburnea TaxID=1245227 RepID=UPI003C6CC4AD
MTLNKPFQGAAIVDKLLLAWKDFKNYLKHKRNEMNVEELIVRLHIEEDNKSSERRLFSHVAAKANVIEDDQSSKRELFPPKKGRTWDQRRISKKTLSGKCYNCDGMGYKASECKKPKRNREANVAENISQEEMFANLEESENGEKLFIGNSATSEIKGQGKIVLKTNSGKELALNNVFAKFCYVYLLKSKDETIEKFVNYKNEVKNQLSKISKVVRSDRGDEYESLFAEFCAQHDIKHEKIAPYSLQQNDIADRKNRTLKEMMNALLLVYHITYGGKLFSQKITF